MSTEQHELNVLIEKIRANDTSLDSELNCYRLLHDHGMTLCLFSTMTDHTLVCRLPCDRRNFCAVYGGVESEHYLDSDRFERYF